MCLATSNNLVLVGGSGGIVNSLDFYPASLKSLGCFYFRCVLFFTIKGGDSEFEKFTLPISKAFLETRNQNVFWQQAITCCSCYRMPQNAFFFFFSLTKSRSSDQPKNDTKTLFFHPPPLFPGNFCNCNSAGFCTAA